MKVQVRFFGPVRKPTSGTGPVDLPEGATVAELLARLGYNEEEARHLLVSHRGSRLGPETQLRPGMTVDLSMRLGGG